KPDVAAADTFAIHIFLGHGDGTFDVGETYPGATIATRIVTGDFDGDGIVDLAEIGITTGVTLLLGNGNGTFTPGSLPLDTQAASIEAADFDGDGRSDLVVSLNFEDTLAVYPSNGDGTFGDPVSVSLVNLGTLAVGGVNGDGKPDIVAATT